MVEKLIFLSHTRPDTDYALSIVSRFMNKPQEPHAQAVKHIYMYLQRTTDFALHYRQGEVANLYRYTDAD